MAKKQRWTRVQRKSGPANVLDGRWRVRQLDIKRWGAYDEKNRLPVFEPGKFGVELYATTMAALKAKLQELVDTGAIR